MKNKAALIVAIVLGLIAVFAVQSYVMRIKKAVYQGMETKKVVVAKRDIPKGTVISMELIEAKEVPLRFIDSRAIAGKENVKMILGQRTRYNIRGGNQILWSDLGVERKEGLAGRIVESERAITLAVDDITGVAGMIEPNDHVDILGTFTMPKTSSAPQAGEGTPASPEIEFEIATVTLLQNVTVIATGQEMAGQQSPLGKEMFGREAGYPSVTVSVTPIEAQLLVFAQGQGGLTLALRNTEDIGIVEDLPKVTFDSIKELTHIRDLTKERKERIEVIRGKDRTME